MSELYINLPQIKKVHGELSGIPQDIRRKVQSLDSIEQYVKNQISGGGELQRQIQSIREELERIAGGMESYGNAFQQICSVYESSEDGIVKYGLGGYANAKETSGDDVPWYKTDTFKWVAGTAVIVGAVVAAAVLAPLLAPGILATVVVGAITGAAVGAVVGAGAGLLIGGYLSEKNGGTFAEGAADGFFWGSIGGAVSGAVGGIAAATEAGLFSLSVAEGIVGAEMYTAEKVYDGGQVNATELAMSFSTAAMLTAGGAVLAERISQGLGKLPGMLKNGSKQTLNAAEGAEKGSGKNFKLSELTDDEIANIAKEYQKKSPIEIPEGASYKAQSKTGYEQISYKWNDGTYKYESRWHTKTPGAPETQGNTWVIQRNKPGSGGTKPYTEFLAGDDWVPASKWYDAITARKSGTATKEQMEILDKGHWKE